MNDGNGENAAMAQGSSNCRALVRLRRMRLRRLAERRDFIMALLGEFGRAGVARD